MKQPLPQGFRYIGAGVYVGPPDNTLSLPTGANIRITHYSHQTHRDQVIYIQVKGGNSDGLHRLPVQHH